MRYSVPEGAKLRVLDSSYSSVPNSQGLPMLLYDRHWYNAVNEEHLDANRQALLEFYDLLVEDGTFMLEESRDELKTKLHVLNDKRRFHQEILQHRQKTHRRMVGWKAEDTQSALAEIQEISDLLFNIVSTKRDCDPRRYFGEQDNDLYRYTLNLADRFSLDFERDRTRRYEMMTHPLMTRQTLHTMQKTIAATIVLSQYSDVDVYCLGSRSEELLCRVIHYSDIETRDIVFMRRDHDMRSLMPHITIPINTGEPVYAMPGINQQTLAVVQSGTPEHIVRQN